MRALKRELARLQRSAGSGDLGQLVARRDDSRAATSPTRKCSRTGASRLPRHVAPARQIEHRALPASRTRGFHRGARHGYADQTVISNHCAHLGLSPLTGIASLAHDDGASCSSGRGRGGSARRRCPPDGDD